VTVLDLSGKVTSARTAPAQGQAAEPPPSGQKEPHFQPRTGVLVDSAGLGALVSAYTTVTREGGSLKLVNVTKRLQDLLSITKLLTVFETFDSEDEALRSFS
jgi:anti-sigma B factor antagonist